ncbi:hypothetical protein [Congregibacter litoralis]|uniref:Uncharacterized protein n=1 Tax=Congregibacter litoralis KT71 TaxID=314285 RepID=A4AC11_9GAMM|nr:hypothetical protein [Congregibacter litoralis]EAQ96461.1 hypothetical protein KT71_05537 [Congregibacter litoralis KT71]
MIKTDNHISQRSKSAATDSISEKLRVLTEWADAGIPWVHTDDGELLLNKKGDPKPDFFPTSIRKFCTWDGSQNCEFVRQTLPQFSSNSQDTLSRPHNAKLKHSVVTTIELAKAKRDSQVAVQAKRDWRTQLSLEVKELEQKRAALAAQIAEFEHRAMRAERELKELQAAHNRNVTHLTEELQSLRNENASLRRQGHKIFELPKRDRHDE